MSEYLIQDTTLINIANPLRTLGETTGTKTPAQMATIATNANTTIAAQGILLDDVIAALEGKIAPPMPSLPNAEDYMFGYVPVMPVKGDIITMNLDGTDKEYLVLKINDSVAEVLARENVNDSIAFNARTGYSLYGNETLDTYLNITFYNTLIPEAKAAIVDKNIIQYEYAAEDVYNENTHASYADYSGKSQRTVIGDRHIYALGVEDIEEYFNNTFSTSDIQEMFNTSNVNIWLNSSTYGGYAWCVSGGDDYLTTEDPSNYCAVCPAFQIDLSKITWAPSN